MRYINIITTLPYPIFESHINNEVINGVFDIRENSNINIDWDCVVVYQNAPKELKCRCRSGNLLYFCGEPPLMRPCPHAFTEQFDAIFLPHKNARHRNKIKSHGFLPWSFSYHNYVNMERYDYSQLSVLEPKKTKLISIVTSNKTMMPGHNQRMEIIKNLQKDYNGLIDIYGRGINPIENKVDALFSYMFHICMENSFIDDYWTEKFADPILAQCVPIYAGCTNIHKYFPYNSYYTFDVNNYKDLKCILDQVFQKPNERYTSMKKGLEKMRKTLMEKENLIACVVDYLNRNSDAPIKDYYIEPMETYFQYKVEALQLRAKRFFLSRRYK